VQCPFRLADVVDINSAAADVANRRVVARIDADGARRSLGRNIRNLRDLSD
jgi:hypothetical protein